jgi:hypothetical protein
MSGTPKRAEARYLLHHAFWPISTRIFIGKLSRVVPLPRKHLYSLLPLGPGAR